ncbi:phosphoribosylglycinamide formyltransferase [Metabacillus iocasae]|uniref:Phosphoribosylglycinamide formyltransferase n=1 Tax=Priestia iocasae TaxID=2291674 RepID=A0ABS2QXT4_9BACI|nr:phosphoribosylglycinamide formyltransferase [Metabacillus iocasae]MBM7704240.1 phosphoribosylglycinamide formyltransferase-1 [Metabacillus iocasae]
MMNIAVFASGNGSNFQAIYDATQRGDLQANITIVVCDKPGASVIERAEKVGIPTLVCSPKEFASKAAYEQEIVKELATKKVEFIILAGYMRIIGEVLLKQYPNRIVNIHPSLLPAFPGKDAVGQALKAGVKVTGVTVHYVDAGMDTGPIIDQVIVPIGEADTREQVEHHIHFVEHRFYPEVLQRVLTKQTLKA